MYELRSALPWSRNGCSASAKPTRPCRAWPKPLPEPCSSLPRARARSKGSAAFLAQLARALNRALYSSHCPGHARHRGKELLLFAESGLLVVGAVERIEVREELLRVRLHHVPGRIADHRIETTALRREHVGKRQFPMEELQLRSQTLDNGGTLSRRLDGTSAGSGHGPSTRWVGRPEPDGTPFVHALFQLLQRPDCLRRVPGNTALAHPGRGSASCAGIRIRCEPGHHLSVVMA